MYTFRRFLIRFLTITSIIYTSTVTASTLHLITVADVHDRVVGHSVKQDVFNMHNKMFEIASQAGMRFDEYLFAGETFKREIIIDEIDKITVDPDDTIFFFYTGHGYRTLHKPTPWPVIFFGWEKRGLDVESVMDHIYTKNARMTLIFTDCCNTIFTSYEAPEYTIKTARKLPQYPLNEGYIKLFREFSGRIVATGAEEGTPSLGYNSKGGVFTLALIDAIDEEAKYHHPLWEAIFEKITRKISPYQTPVYEIDVDVM